MRHRLLVLAGTLLVGVVAACTSSDVVATPGAPSFVRLPGSSVGGKPLVATLTGAAEVPGPGDSDGRGSATVSINRGKGELCYQLNVADIGTAVAAHIHRGIATAAGGVVVDLAAPASGSSQGCLTNVAPALLDDISENPAGFYVNVHTAAFPAGAVRGQLGNR
jgi:hypothetical protein